MANKKLIDTLTLKSPNGDSAMVRLSTRHTSYKNYEYAEAEMGGRSFKGIYTWENRPWQRYDFEVALKHLCEKLTAATKAPEGFYEAQIDAWHKDRDVDMDGWYDAFKKAWDNDVNDDIKARTAKVLSKTGHAISSKEEAEAILSMATAFSLMQSVMNGGDGGTGK